MAAFWARACCWRTAVLAGFVAMLAGPLAGQTVTNVRVRQLADKTVEVLFDLTGAPSPGATVTLAYQADGCPAPGITLPASVLSGNVGAGVVSGTNLRIVWNAAATLAAGTNQSNFYVTVTAVLPTTPTPTPTITPTPTPTRTPTPTPTPTPTVTGTPIPGLETSITLPGGVPLVVVRIPAGTFQMGSPDGERARDPGETEHSVTLTNDYYLGKTEVTQAQWQAVMGVPMRTECGSHGTGASYPVYCVSWNDIAGIGGFIERLNAHLASTGQAGAGNYRLPTEAEWERAARAGTSTRFSFGGALDCSDGSCSATGCSATGYTWWCANSGYVTHPVGAKQPNAYGLYDVHGNVWEWVADWYGAYPVSAQTNPTGPATGTMRVSRGGGVWDFIRDCRSADRSYDNLRFVPTRRDRDLGFRLARSQ